MQKKVVVISGASSGVGQSAARFFLKTGEYEVVNFSRSPSCVQGIRDFKTDITIEENVKNSVESVINEFGRIDIVISNSGIGIYGASVFTDSEQAEKQMKVNFYGLFYLSKYTFPALEKTKGKFLSVSSVASSFPIPFHSFYSASKAAADDYVLAMRSEIAPLGVQAAVVALGDTKTSFTAHRYKSLAGDEVLGGAVSRSLSVMEKNEEDGMDRDFVGSMIFNIACRKKLYPYYVIGLRYQLFALFKRFVPVSVMMKIITLLYRK